ncbi:MAG: HisA/HisF-related TIM barrel protein [Chloroherpetonaceae bacterium]
MLLVIPSLDLKNGKSVQRIRSDNGNEFYYKELMDHPIEFCKLLRRENAKTLHINDLDGDYHSPNRDIILEIVNTLDIPITLSSTSNNIEDCKYYLEEGIFRVSICSYAIENPEGAEDLMKQFSSTRVIFHCFVQDDSLIIGGKKSEYKYVDFINLIKLIGGKRLIYGHTDWMGNTRAVNIDKLKEIATLSQMKISLFDGAPNYKILKDLQDHKYLGVDSVIFSASLYENNFPCQAIWRLAEVQ